MKILRAEQIRAADQFTIQHEPIDSIDLMERAAAACCRWLESHFPAGQRFKIFCGTGNNGGDGLAIARMLNHSGFSVEVFVCGDNNKSSADFISNEKRFLSSDPMGLKRLHTEKDFPVLEEGVVVIDALFGTGLSRPVKGLVAQLIGYMNQSNAVVVAIDLPSGLSADSPPEEGSAVVYANHTLTFQSPKLSFMFPSGGIYVGRWTILDIGLDRNFLRTVTSALNYFTQAEASLILKKRPKFSHKGNFGHALLVSGSKGKSGAAVLAARACLRSGVGLLTVHAPGCATTVLQTTVPEAMVVPDPQEEFLSATFDVSDFSAIGIGPGIGTGELTWETVRHLLYTYRKPMVLDADALNLLAQHQEWYDYLPAGSILTPHPKEFERLTRKAKDDPDRFSLQQEFSKKHKVYVVLKGAHTCICAPDGSVFFNSSGNPGMARGGSGDALTGIILGLLAQSVEPLEAALLGVYIHGLSGDIAASLRTETGMTAGDLVRALPFAWKKLENIRNV